MQFLTSLFGGSENTLLTALFALGAVLVLIAIGAWLLRLITGGGNGAARGRNRRMSVVEAMAIDPKRQLIIIRRDNVEHLILTGGPQDVVVETGIAVEEAAPPQPVRRPIPTVPARRPTSVATAPQATPGTAVEQLRQAGLATDRKQHLSLRHTGLLRPVQDNGASTTENSVSGPAGSSDSAKESRGQQGESTTIAGNTEANRL